MYIQLLIEYIGAKCFLTQNPQNISDNMSEHEYNMSLEFSSLYY